MSAPIADEIYLHPDTGWRFLVLATLPTSGTVLLRRIDPPTCRHEIWGARASAFAEHFTLDSNRGLATLNGLVDALGDALRRPGQPHPSEFTTGPSGPGPLWDDKHLAEVFGLRGDDSSWGQG